MIPGALSNNFKLSTVHDYHPLNTSDHRPLSISINIGATPWAVTEGPQPIKLRWDKMSPDAMMLRYQAPMSTDLKFIFEHSCTLKFHTSRNFAGNLLATWC